MLAFLLFTIFLLASYGLIHKMWNNKRDKQDVLDAQSKSSYKKGNIFC
jgi:MFS transporter, ACS family, allantoate permease